MSLRLFVRPRNNGRACYRVPIACHEAADAVERFGGDAAAMAKAAGELAVVDGAAAEGGFGKSGVPAVVGDFLQQLLRIHGAGPWCSSGARWAFTALEKARA
jgi:hypothetical protein